MSYELCYIDLVDFMFMETLKYLTKTKHDQTQKM